MEEIFILLADGDGTLRSVDSPWGAAVRTEEEAKRYVKEGNVGYSHSYISCKIFNTHEEARREIYGKLFKEMDGKL